MEIFWISLVIGITLFAGTSAVRQCERLVVDGVRNWPLYDGLYIRSDSEKCHNRVVYSQLNKTNSKTHYIYFYNPDVFNYGWVIGEHVCSDTGKVYGPHVHDRPDYLLGYWREMSKDGNWFVNERIQVRCTEGLSYGALIGLLTGLLLGVPLLIFIILGIVKSIEDRKKESSRRRRRRRRRHLSEHHRRHHRHRNRNRDTDNRGNPVIYNIGLDPNNPSILPPYALEPPSYEEIGEWHNSSLLATNDISTFPETPPIYDVNLYTSPTYDVITGDRPSPPSYTENSQSSPASNITTPNSPTAYSNPLITLINGVNTMSGSNPPSYEEALHDIPETTPTATTEITNNITDNNQEISAL